MQFFKSFKLSSSSLTSNIMDWDTAGSNKVIKSEYDDITATVKVVEVTPGGDAWLNCIDVYVEVVGI